MNSLADTRSLRIIQAVGWRGDGKKISLFTKINVSSGIKIDDNLLSLSFSGSSWHWRHHNATAALHKSAHWFDKPTVTPHGKVNLCNTHFIYLHVRLRAGERIPGETHFDKSPSTAPTGFLCSGYFNSRHVVMFTRPVEVVVCNTYCVACRLQIWKRFLGFL